MADFQHILITRFNLRDPARPWTQLSKQDRVQWMQHRWNLFTNYCLPSVLNQSVNNFNWLIYFDQETPKFYKNEIQAIAKTHPFIIPLFVKSYDCFLADLSRNCLDLKNPTTTHFITSRIDNDDCFHRDAMKAIQSQYSGQSYQLVNLAKGVCLRIEPDVAASVYTYYAGPFISLIEEMPKAGSLQSIFEKDHHEYLKDKPIIHLESIAYWIQVIHSCNVSNRLIGRPIQVLFAKNDFGFELKKPWSISCFLASLIYTFLRKPYSFAKNVVRQILGKPLEIKA